MSIEYPKIDTLFERDKATFVVDPTLIKKPVFQTISKWGVTEKVDGTNIRVMFDPQIVAPDSLMSSPGPVVSFNGRTNNANLPGDLVQHLTKTFTPSMFSEKFQTPITLYGEGYGAGIQKCGGQYRKDKSFILFDVLVDNTWWMSTQEVISLGQSMGIDTVPYLGCWSLEDIIRNVREGFLSRCSIDPTLEAEGVVARPIQTLFDSRHERVILKLKKKDFVAGKR